MFTTNSLELASYLAIKKGIKFIELDSVKMEFVFKDKKVADKAIEEYYAGKALVNPLELQKKYQQLKQMVFDAKRGLIQPE